MENAQSLVPCLPESAPFTAEQRAYLNGFLAGLFSRVSAPPGPASAPGSAVPLKTLSILFASQTGTAEGLAKRLAKEAGRRGFAPTVHDLAKYTTAQLASETCVLLIASTYGDGDPPDNARPFWDFLNRGEASRLPQARFSVCALGDSNYPKFCGFGKQLDERLATLGAERVHVRADCDLEYEEPFAAWTNAALTALSGSRPDAGLSPEVTRSSRPGADASPSFPPFDRQRPFASKLLTNRKLNGLGSEKDIRHFEFSLDGSGLAYEAGDALGVYPVNCLELVDEILSALKSSGEESVPGRDGKDVPFREALRQHYEITRIPQVLLQAVAERTGDDHLKKVTAPDANGSFSQFVYGREIIDLLTDHPEATFAPTEFIKLLKKLAPRLYSISSSPKAHPGQVHLTVNILRYESLGRPRKGVCSTFMAERADQSTQVPIFVQAAKHFRLPTVGEVPVIMVGPGTGIAPFRAFLEDRRATGAQGRNWLFFGEQRAATDFLYRDELLQMQQDRVLTRLDTAFSRDQTEKVYVQQRMREQARELFAWLEAGAHFYVCGDARRMAKDVEAALHEIIQSVGQRSTESAAEYVNQMKVAGRYQRDVY